MKDLHRQARVTRFLRESLAKAPQDVLTLEAMARTEGLLGERQRITNAGVSTSQVFSTHKIGSGWFWTEGRLALGIAFRWRRSLGTFSYYSPPIGAERRVPVDWVKGSPSSITIVRRVTSHACVGVSL